MTPTDNDVHEALPRQGPVVKSTLNVVGGVEVECYDETVGQTARVVIRNSRGQKFAVLLVVVEDGHVAFTQQSAESQSERHAFTVLPNQQFCGAKLSDSFTCCLPRNHKIHKEEDENRK